MYYKDTGGDDDRSEVEKQYGNVIVILYTYY